MNDTRPTTPERGSSREAILTRVRAALGDVGPEPAEVDTPIPWSYARTTPMTDPLARFVETVDDYRATVQRCPQNDVPARIAEALTSAGVDTVVLPAGVPQLWRAAIAAAGIEICGDVEGERLGRRRLDGVGAVVTGAAIGIAETGTIVLDHRGDQGRRALTLIPDMHVCVVRCDQVVSDVPEGVARLEASVRQGRPLTWISGPSATSDIELDRVEGVHGPRNLHVILAG